MTGKERAKFRKEANKLQPLFQLGKGGINDSFIQSVDDALTARELIKLKVLLESSPIKPRQAADEIAEKTNSDVIQVIGGVIVLYRYSPQLAKKNEEKKRNKKLAQKKAKEKYVSPRDIERSTFGKKKFFK